MKKFYNEPEMNISTFSEQDVVTTSGVNGEISSEEAYTSAGTSAKASIAFDALKFTF